MHPNSFLEHYPQLWFNQKAQRPFFDPHLDYETGVYILFRCRLYRCFDFGRYVLVALSAPFNCATFSNHLKSPHRVPKENNFDALKHLLTLSQRIIQKRIALIIANF